MRWSGGARSSPGLHVLASGRRVRLDLNNPAFQEVFFRLELAELKQVVASLRRLAELDWVSVYRHTGFRWEAIAPIKPPNGATMPSD